METVYVAGEGGVNVEKGSIYLYLFRKSALLRKKEMKRGCFLVLSILSLLSLTSSKDISSYEKEKTSINNCRTNHFSKFNDNSITAYKKKEVIHQAGKDLQNAIIEKLIPYWYGTEWDFNGYTAIPGKGKIACGYFVSTVMLHAGFNLNRYKMAQKHSFDELKEYSCGDSIYSYPNTTQKELVAKIRESFRQGLYIIALENHIGFLLHENDEVFFIHSNYREPSVVVKEKVEQSMAIKDSGRFMLVSITNNEPLLNNWLANARIGG